MTAIVLALGASVCWGVGDFLGGVGSRRTATLTVLAVSQFAGLAGLTVVVLLATAEPFGRDGFAFAILAGLGGLVGLGALYRAMAVGAIAVVAPISAAAAAIPVIYGLAHGERPQDLQLAGIAVVLAGVALASREPRGLGGRLASGAGLALVAAAGFGWYFIAIDAASGRDPLWAVLVARAAACSLAVALAGARGALSVRQSMLPLLVAVGVFDVSANVMLAFALTHGYVSVVSVLASLYPVVTVGLAFAVLHERLDRVQAAGVTVALAGVALISVA